VAIVARSARAAGLSTITKGDAVNNSEKSQTEPTVVGSMSKSSENPALISCPLLEQVAALRSTLTDNELHVVLISIVAALSRQAMSRDALYLAYSEVCDVCDKYGIDIAVVGEILKITDQIRKTNPISSIF